MPLRVTSGRTLTRPSSRCLRASSRWERPCSGECSIPHRGPPLPTYRRDYARDKGALKDGLGHIPMRALTAQHVAEYRDVRAQTTSHIRHELACLSAALSYAVEAGRVAANP